MAARARTRAAGPRAPTSRSLRRRLRSPRRMSAGRTRRAFGSTMSGCCSRLVRRFGPLSKIEVARLTGLSVQSTSAIMNRLQADGLLKREAPLRGRVGQPTIPMSLDPEGAYSFGLKIGRRSCDLVLIDFRGAIRQRARRAYAFPTPTMILDFVHSSLLSLVGFAHRARRSGGSPASASLRRSSCGTGKPRSARRQAQ